MDKVYFSCVILKPDHTNVSVDITFNDYTTAKLVYNQFRENLYEENFGLILTQNKNDIYKNKFSYVRYGQGLKSKTGNFAIKLYRKNRFICELEVQNSQSYYILYTILRSYGLKYYIKKVRDTNA